MLLQVRGLEVDYRRRPDATSGPTVGDVDLDVHRGEVIALVGESGSGKPTMAWTLAGLRTPFAGGIVLHPGGQPGEAADLARPARRHPRRSAAPYSWCSRTRTRPSTRGALRATR